MMTTATVTMEVRFRRLRVLRGAFHLTDLIRRIYPIGNRLVDRAARLTRVEYRLEDGRWRTAGSLRLVPGCRDCDCPGCPECSCTDETVFGIGR